MFIRAFCVIHNQTVNQHISHLSLSTVLFEASYLMLLRARISPRFHRVFATNVLEFSLQTFQTVCGEPRDQGNNSSSHHACTFLTFGSSPSQHARDVVEKLYCTVNRDYYHKLIIKTSFDKEKAIRILDIVH
jgi:hypothetical protein